MIGRVTNTERGTALLSSNCLLSDTPYPTPGCLGKPVKIDMATTAHALYGETVMLSIFTNKCPKLLA